MTTPPSWTHWFDRLRAAAPHCFMQLASSGEQGPRLRTLTLREHHGDTLWFTTDTRSVKASHLADDPRAEACWYDLTSRVQWRFAGRVDFLTRERHAEHCQRLWDRLDEQARARFNGPPPGSPWHGEPTPAGATPTAHFALLRLTVHNVDVLELACTPHRHWFYRGEQAPRRLVP